MAKPRDIEVTRHRSGLTRHSNQLRLWAKSASEKSAFCIQFASVHRRTSGCSLCVSLGCLFGPMDFRYRNVGELVGFSVKRLPTLTHPLREPSLDENGTRSASSPNAKATPGASFVDPLGAMLAGHGRDNDDGNTVSHRDITQNDASTSEDEDEDGLDVPTEDANVLSEWSGKRRQFINRAQRVGTTVRVMNNGNHKGPISVQNNPAYSTTVSNARERLEALEDTQTLQRVEQSKELQSETVDRLRELSLEIDDSWRTENRLDALRYIIKVASLLDPLYPVISSNAYGNTRQATVASITHSTQFYPILFGLVTKILDKAGDAIYERVFQKAQFNDNTKRRIAVLRKNFTSDDVHEDAKKTCSNWFRKIDGISDQIPKVYLQLAVLKCWRFIQNDSPFEKLKMITNEIKLIEDPLVVAYLTAYTSKTASAITAFRRNKTQGPQYHQEHIRDVFRDLISTYTTSIDRFDFTNYASRKRKERRQIEKTQLETDGDVIDAIDAWLDSWFEEIEEQEEGVVGAGGSNLLSQPTPHATATWEEIQTGNELISKKRLAVVAPAVEYAASLFSKRSDEKTVSEFLVEVLDKAGKVNASGENENTSSLYLTTLVTRVLLQQMSSEFVSEHAARCLKLVEKLNDLNTCDVCFVLGERLCNSPESLNIQTAKEMTQAAWQVVYIVTDSITSFLKCADIWLDFAVRSELRGDNSSDSDHELRWRLADVSTRVTSEQLTSMDPESQVHVERILGRALRRACSSLKKESITALLNSEAFISLASYLSGSALVAFHNSVLTTFTSFEFLSTDAVAESVIIPFAVRCAETVHKDLVQRIRSDTSESVTISSTQPFRLIMRFIDRVVFGFTTQQKTEKALRFLQTIRKTFFDDDETLRALCVRSLWLGESKGETTSTGITHTSFEFKSSCVAFCCVTLASVHCDTTKATLYLRAARVALTENFDYLFVSRLVCSAIRSYGSITQRITTRIGKQSNREAVQIATTVAGLLCVLERKRKVIDDKTEKTKKIPLSKPVCVFLRFAEKLAASLGDSFEVKVTLNVLMVRLLSSLAQTRNPDPETLNPDTEFLLELSHLYAQRAVDFAELVDEKVIKSEKRTAARVDVAETFASCFQRTKDMTVLIHTLLQRALNDCPTDVENIRKRITVVQEVYERK